MTYVVQKRKCRRFKVPGAQGKYKKSGPLSILDGFSNEFPVIDISKGGLSFVCDEKLRKRKKLMVKLSTPDTIDLELRSRVRRQGLWSGSHFMITGIEFMPFGSGLGGNPLEYLDILRDLDNQYGKHEYPGEHPHLGKT
jgi:hypothetical protein